MTSLPVVFRAQARQELREAQAWYEDQVTGLGLAFARAVDVAVEVVAARPESFAVVDGPYRQCVMRRFPFSMMFRVAEHRVVIVAVHHQRRRPRRWG